MFQVRHAGAKGFGLFASQHIARGKRMLAEQPLISIDNKGPDILAAAAKLSSSQRRVLLELSLNEANKSILSLIYATWKSFPALGSVLQNRDILNIFYNNNFALGDEDDRRAVFPTVARINHSCVPNAQGNFNTNLGTFTIHALRDIATQEEITISYLGDQLALRQARQAHLQRGYGFACGCELCAASPGRQEASHGRRSRLHEQLKAFAERQLPATALDGAAEESHLIRAMISVYEEDGIAGREVASLYSANAGLEMTLGHADQASALGAKSLELERDAVGEDSPFYEECLVLSQRRSGQGTTVEFLPEKDIRRLETESSPQLQV
jgi:hypothetical protein